MLRWLSLVLLIGGVRGGLNEFFLEFENGFTEGPEGSDLTIRLEEVSTFSNARATYDEGAAEIAAYDSANKRVFVTNSETGSVDVFDVSDPYNPQELPNLAIMVGSVNSVAIKDGLMAVAIDDDQDPGKVSFYSLESNGSIEFVKNITVGALPDMVTFTPNGKYVLVANEGEPNDDYDNDPEGSVTIIPVSSAVLGSGSVVTVGFTSFNADEIALKAAGVRIFGPGATVAQDLEPEYIAVSSDSKTAYVALQENNAIAIVDIENAQVMDIVPLGFKDYSLPENAIDASNEDVAINIQTWPAYGMYQPDGIATFEVGGKTYVATANEGDARDYDGFSEESRVNDVTLDTVAFPDAATLQQEANLGRLQMTTALGDTDGDGDFDEIYSYGGRSFSILDEDGNMVWDSGNQFETITAARVPDIFNANNPDEDESQSDEFDNRSDDKGPEPEGITVGEVLGKQFAFIGLERIGGIMVYDVSDPLNPSFVDYVRTEGDFGPEGLLFVPAESSPILGVPVLIVTNEVSGTITMYRIESIFVDDE